MPDLKTGILAPKFKLPDQNGDVKSLADFGSKHVVLYFYPKDLTPGCTLEAQEFSKKAAAFKKLDAEVVGISGGDSDSKQKFCKKHNLKITLLADEEFAIAKKFGAFGKKQFMGKTYNGIMRKTFVLNSSGKIVHIYPEVTPAGHADEVLKFLSQIGKKTEKGRNAVAAESPKHRKRVTKVMTRSKAGQAKQAARASR